MKDSCWHRKFTLDIIAAAMFVLFASDLHGQTTKMIPPVPYLSAQAQIGQLVKSFLQGMIHADINRIQALTEDEVATKDQRTQYRALASDVAGLQIKTVDVSNNLASADVVFANVKGDKIHQIHLNFRKKGLFWKFMHTAEFDTVLTTWMFPSGHTNSGVGIQSASRKLHPQSQGLQYTNTALISIPHPDAGNLYVLNSGYTNTNIQRNLFCPNAPVPVAGYYTDAYVQDGIAFSVDPYWNRIIYTQKTGNWIKSYGDNSGDYKFSTPKALAADVYGNLFVTNTDYGIIVELSYGSGVLSSPTPYSIPGMIHPISIAIDQSGSFSGNPQNDLIFIADDFAKEIFIMHRDGSSQVVSSYYDIDGNTYPIKDPVAVQSQDNGRLAFIDGSRNAFILATPPTSPSTTATAIQSTIFDKSSSLLNSIGMDGNSEWWVGDILNKALQKFSKDGVYLATYTASNTNPGQFSSPVAVSKAPYFNLGQNVNCYVYTSDLWTGSSGMRAFFPGVDLLGLSYLTFTNELDVYFTLTNCAIITMNVNHTSCGSNTVVWSGNHSTYSPIQDDASGEVLAAGNYTVEIPTSTWTAGWYGVSITVLPVGNSNYDSQGMSALGYGISSIEIRNTPFAAAVTGPTNKLNTGQVATCTANVVGGSGEYLYQWATTTDFINWSTGTQGYQNTLTETMASSNIGARCTVTDYCLTGTCPDWSPVTSSTFIIYYNAPPPPPPPPPPSCCPYVSTWNGKSMQFDNNILPQSEFPGNGGKEVIDYYKLLTPLERRGNNYDVTISEFETERSSLDQFELMAVDHSPATGIAVLDGGKIVEYTTPFTMTGALKDTLSKFDNVGIFTKPDRSIAPHFSPIATSRALAGFENSSSGGLLLGGRVKNKLQSLKCTPKEDGVVLIGGGEAGESDTASFIFRERPTLVYVPMKKLRENVTVSIDKPVTLDYVNLAREVQPEYSVQDLLMTSAYHSTQGNVKERLIESDGSYVTLSPGESIALSFSAPPDNPNTKRDFIFVSHGSYEHLKGTELNEKPKNFSLSQNYPNPFNPTTTISYQLSQDGYLNLAIYNVLGQVVVVLGSGQTSAGSYTATWNASQSNSGIYYVRMLVTSSSGKSVYQSTKKILLMK
jgi:hypothetical protein